MSPEEIANIEKQIKQLEDTLEQEATAKGGLEAKIAKAQEDETFNKSQFLKYHLIIYYYELEIEGMTGEYIKHPFEDKDIENLADNKGRLYQGTVGTDAKIIPELVGGGLASSPRSYELDRRSYIDTLLSIIRYGTNNSLMANNVNGYVAGDDTIELGTDIGSNLWVFVGQYCLIKIGVPTVIPPVGSGVTSTYSYPITDRLVDTNSMSDVLIFNGFNNSQRSSKNGGSYQGIMNLLVGKIGDEISAWLALLTHKTKRACDLNTDSNFDITARNEAQHTYDYLQTFMMTIPVDDMGIGQLITQMDSRQIYFLGSRIQDIRNAKKMFYDLRVNFVNLRGDIQSGSLTRIRYMSNLSDEIPSGGTPQQRKTLEVLKGLLE